MSICTDCGRVFLYARNKGGTKTRCNACQTSIRRYLLRVKIIEYLGGKCIDCGFTGCHAAMHAHHLEPDEKDFSIGNAYCRSWQSIEAELKKCVLLCANCHATRHHDHVRAGCPAGGIQAVEEAA